MNASGHLTLTGTATLSVEVPVAAAGSLRLVGLAVVPSRRQRVIEAVMGRLALILPENGYATDAGARVHYGRVDLSAADELPALLLRAETETIQGEGNQIVRQLPLAVHMVALADKQHPLLPIEPLLEDVRRALFPPTEAWWLGTTVIRGLEYGERVETHDREPGGDYVEAELTAVARYYEVSGGSVGTFR